MEKIILIGLKNRKVCQINHLYIIVLFCIFQACKSQNNQTHFIYHTAEYDLGVIREERLYHSLTGIYEYNKYSNNKIEKSIKMFLKYDSKDLTAINKLYTSSKSKMIDCYYENGMIAHKSTITFNSQKDDFNLINCNEDQNLIFAEIENKIESYITSSDVYKKTFYWEYYKK